MLNGIGTGVSFARPSVLGPVWVPTTASGCILWLRSGIGVTIGGTPIASGTSPPAVTFTGTLLGAPPLIVTIQVGGALGAAQFNYSTDGGNTFSANIATAATVAIGSTGVTANFPSATYATDNVYKGTISNWADQSGNGNDVSNIAGSQPQYSYDLTLGRRVVVADGISTLLFRSTGGLSGNVDHTLFAKIKYITESSFKGFASIGTGAAAGASSTIGEVSGSFWYGAPGISVPMGLTPVNNTVYRIGKTAVGAGNTQGYVNGATDGTTAANAYALTAGFTICAYSNSANQSTPSPISEVVAYSRVLSAGEIASLDAYLASA